MIGSWAWAYVFFTFACFVVCFIAGLIYSDGQQRFVQHVRLPAPDVALRGALRWTFALAGFMICLSLPLTSSSFFASTAAFSLSTFLRLDMVVIKNVIHGGFMVGSYSNFVESGNSRYHTISLTLLSFMTIPCATGAVLSAVQCYQFGWAGAMTGSGARADAMGDGMSGGAMGGSDDDAVTGFDVWGNLLISVIMLFLVVTCLFVQRRAFAISWTTKYKERTQLLAAGQEHARNAMGSRTHRPRAQYRTTLVLILAVVASGLPEFDAMRASARRWILGEGVVFALVYGLIFVNRLPSMWAAPIPFSTYTQAFIPGYTMSIHLGWTVGNGLFGVDSNSVKCIELYGLAKIVLGSLTAVQTGSLAVHVFGWLAPGQGVLSILVPSVVVSTIYVIVQAMILVRLQALRTALYSINFNTDLYIPAGSAVAASFGFSVWDLAQLTHLTPAARARAARAAVTAVLSVLTFQLEGALLVACEVNIEYFINSLDFGIHSIAIFMLSYYRSVQNYPVRLQRRKTIQMFIMLLYAVVGCVQFGSLLTAVQTTGWTSPHVVVLGLTLSRILIHVVASYSFYHLRIDEEETDPSVICGICCLKWKRTLTTERYRSLYAAAEAIATSSETALQLSSTNGNGDADIAESGSTAALELTAKRLPVAIPASADDVMKATAFWNFDGRSRKPQRIVVKPTFASDEIESAAPAAGNSAASAGTGTTATTALAAIPIPQNTQTTDFLALVKSYNKVTTANGYSVPHTAQSANGAASPIAGGDARVNATDESEHSTLLSHAAVSPASNSTASTRKGANSSADAARIPLSPEFYLHSHFPAELIALPTVAHDSDAVVGGSEAARAVSAVAAAAASDHTGSAIVVTASKSATARASVNDKVAAANIAATTASSADAADAANEVVSSAMTEEERRPFDLGFWVNRQLLYAMSLCGLYLAVGHSFLHDPTGAVLVAGEHASFSAASTNAHDLSLGTWHTPGYSIAFHYCFLVFGYGYRGLIARNVMFMNFITYASASLALVVGTTLAFFVSLSFADAVPAFALTRQWFAIGSFRYFLFGGILSYMLIASLVHMRLMSKNATFIRLNSERFPQSGHSMV